MKPIEREVLHYHAEDLQRLTKNTPITDVVRASLLKMHFECAISRDPKVMQLAVKSAEVLLSDQRWGEEIEARRKPVMQLIEEVPEIAKVPTFVNTLTRVYKEETRDVNRKEALALKAGDSNAADEKEGVLIKDGDV